MDIGPLIKAIRNNSDISLKELSLHLKVDYSKLRNLEEGLKHNFTKDEVATILIQVQKLLYQKIEKFTTEIENLNELDTELEEKLSEL